MSRKLKHALRFRILVEVVEDLEPVAGELNKEPIRRGLETTVPKGCTDAYLAARLEELAAATFGMLEGEMALLETTKIELLGDA